MLEPGQTVLYGTEGICTIEAIETLRIGGKRSKYYVLRPVYRDDLCPDGQRAAVQPDAARSV